MWASVLQVLDIELWSSWQWQTPEWLWLLWLPLAIWGLQFFWHQNAQTQYAPKHLWDWVKVDSNALSSGKRRGFALGIWRLGHVLAWFVKPLQLLAWAWMLWVLAMAGPRLLQSSPETLQRSGLDILIALDVSRSMAVKDAEPSRFLFSKALIESWVNRLQPNDRLGLMVFAAKPHLVTPLTFDRALFGHYLNLMSPNILPTEGSLIKSAVGFGAEHLRVTAGQASVLVVLTDGATEDFEPQPDTQEFLDLLAARQDGKQSPQVWVVGIGGTQSMAIPDATHKSGRYHFNGVLVSSRLESAMLQQLAQQVQGRYWRANNSAEFMDELLAATKGLAQQRPMQGTNQEWFSLASGLIVLSLVCFIWAFWGGRWFKSSSASVAGVLLVFSLMQPQNAVANSQQRTIHSEAFKAFEAGQYEDALKAYDALPNYAGWMGAGAAAYKAGDVEAAVMYFQKAVLVGRTAAERGSSLYNLGNSYYQANLLNHAIESYQQALIYVPDETRAQHNLALAQQRRNTEKDQQSHEEQESEGEGKGNKSRDAEGAFYGGQKPSEQAGEGMAGDAQEGAQDGREAFLPTEEDRTQFSLESFDMESLSTQGDPGQQGNAILAQQRQREVVEAFELKMLSLEDSQKALLQRLFEREEGFQAPQKETLTVPGVKPW